TIQRLIAQRALTMFLAAIVFIVPFTSLINTTPWSLAFLFFIITFLLSLLYIQKKYRPLLGIAMSTTIAALFIHPLGGIPALIVSGMTIVIYELLPHLRHRLSRMSISIAAVIGASILVPMAFAINNLFSTQLSIRIAPPDDTYTFIKTIGSHFFSYTSRFNVWQDTAYLLPFMFGAILVASAIGVTLYYWNIHRMYRRALATLWACWLALFINVVLVKGFVHFTSIVSYEQGVFTDRLYEASMIVLLPFGMIALHSLLCRLYTTSKHYPLLKIASVVGFAALMTANLYASYPKRDAYNAYHGYMVSAANIATVQWIAQDAGEQSHIVLASQVVAAAAIQEYGFKQYFRREIDGEIQDVFYYPVPTSSPLYADYRTILSSPTYEKIYEIMETYGISKVYVVVNHYEPQYEGKNNALRPLASHEEVIHKGHSEDTVFVFGKN
ncbi:MAG: hypothetical protein AAB870_04415, partial [Patescibacteria group bacterium]